MSPRTPDEEIRTALIEAAARVLVEEGPPALTTRRLSREVGTSTMALYTYFGGMDELKQAVRREGFQRLAERLDEVPRTRDAVADLAALGAAYFFNALANSDLYRFIFLERFDDDKPDVGHATFDRLVQGVARAVGSGRLRGEPLLLATQLWSMAHGIVTLHLSGLLSFEEAVECFVEMGRNLLVGFGDDRQKAARSIAKVRHRLGIGAASEVGRASRGVEGR